MDEKLVQIGRVRKRDLHEAVVSWNAERRRSILPPQLPLDRLSKDLNERVTVAKDSPIPDCTTCGVCCEFAVLVPVSFEESKQIARTIDVLLDDVEEEIVIDRILPRNSDGRCENLMGRLGESIGCSIYEKRPSPCRDFEAGSDRCHEFRRMYGIEKQLSDEEFKAALAKLEEPGKKRVIEDVSIVSSGKVERMSFSAKESVSVQTTAELLTIVAFLNDDTQHELHSFEYGKEVWLESDLLGLTLDEAKKRIE